ncbi:hypothetical protein [Pinisolibacter sp.]|uniref:hypothetical protein n=1 Tax=Pinisolibacter sp. TaxID=2172024 RepID=UPI002FDCB1B0
MSTDRFDIPSLEARLAETERKISALQERAAKLTAAITSLRALDAVLSDDNFMAEVAEFALSVPKRQSKSKLGPARPEGTPSNFEMAKMVLISAERDGKAGLTAAELVSEIGRRYWPGLQPQQILPMMYQYAKHGRLNKGDDGLFRLPKREGEPKGSPKPEVGEDSTPPDFMR